MHSLEESVRLLEHKIESVLFSMDLITEEKLEEALGIQKTDGRNLGKLLVSLGYLSTDAIWPAPSLYTST
jgi:hypothetical protein